MTGNPTGDDEPRPLEQADEPATRWEESPFLIPAESATAIPEPTPPDKRAFRVVFFISCLLVAIALCLAPLLFRSTFHFPLHAATGLFLAGLIAATPISFSIYLSFGRDSWWFKWGAALLAGVIFFVSMNVGVLLIREEWISIQQAAWVLANLCKGEEPISNSASHWVHWNLSILFITPAVLFVAMTPVWIVRHLFQWRLCVPSYDKAAPKLSIFGLMTATGFVAIVIAGIRGFAWLTYLDDSGDIPTFFWLLLFVSLAVCAVAVAIVQFIGLWTILRFKDLSVASGIVLIPLGLITLTACLTIAVNDPRVSGSLLLFIFMLDGFLLAACLPMVLLRRFGYRIVAGNRLPDSDFSTENNE